MKKILSDYFTYKLGTAVEIFDYSNYDATYIYCRAQANGGVIFSETTTYKDILIWLANKDF